eukprot:SAG31_NODE_711_length_12665_cov_2.283225_10_plen_168_part_00
MARGVGLVLQACSNHSHRVVPGLMGTSRIALFFAVQQLVGSADSHGILRVPVPRLGASTAFTNKGNGIGPCGRGSQNTKGENSARYFAGETIVMDWRIQIPHPIGTTNGTSHCEIHLSSEDGAAAPPMNRDREGPSWSLIDGPFPCGLSAGPEQRLVSSVPEALQCS